MRKIPLILIAIFLLIMSGNISAFAQCKGGVTISANSDYDLDVTSGPYDPCYNYVSWAISFHRTTNTMGTETLQFRIAGTSMNQYVSSLDFHEGGDYYLHNTQYVGPSTSHEMIIHAAGSSRGFFTNIVFSTVYSNGSPTGPQGE